LDCSAGGRWQRQQDNLGAFAAYTQDPVAVLFAEIGNVGSGCFEDAQAEEPERGGQREVARAG